MPTLILRSEDPDEIETLRALCLSTYLDGECYAFATALHEGLGWPIIGLMHNGEIRHALVQDPEGLLHDVRGVIRKEAHVGQPFDLLPPYDLRQVTVADLVREGEPDYMRAHSVRMARRLAEAIWPELPWKESFAKRVVAFANEFETLCRKHGLWIRASVPASAPLIALGEDDEGGYQLRPTVDGMTFTIDRYFGS